LFRDFVCLDVEERAQAAGFEVDADRGPERGSVEDEWAGAGAA